MVVLSFARFACHFIGPELCYYSLFPKHITKQIQKNYILLLGTMLIINTTGNYTDTRASCDRFLSPNTVLGFLSMPRSGLATHHCLEKLQWQREDDSVILFATDRVESLQVSQLKSCRAVLDDVSCMF